jgi:hypothetical protein
VVDVGETRPEGVGRQRRRGVNDHGEKLGHDSVVEP